VESDYINILTSTVLRDFEQVQDAKEAGLARQCRSNIWKAYRFDRIDLNLAFLHAVARAFSYVGTRPDSHTASDFSATYSFAKSFSEDHERSLRKDSHCWLGPGKSAYRIGEFLAKAAPRWERIVICLGVRVRVFAGLHW
jgi:hypothetical protein